MPTYDRECPEGHVTESVEPMDHPDTRPCPECGEPSRVVIHAPTIHWNGHRTPKFHDGASAEAKKDLRRYQAKHGLDS